MSAEASMPVTQEQIWAAASPLLVGVSEGEGLTALQAALIQFALSSYVTSLDVESSRRDAQSARVAGASLAQLHEVVTLQSSVGVHIFFEAGRMLADQEVPLAERGSFDSERQEIWDERIGDRASWTSMREEIPGFLESLLWQSPEVFLAFLDFAGLAFRMRAVDTLTKELISMASDASSSHRYVPGMRMHLRNALHRGAGRRAIEEALMLASEAPSAVGVR